MHKSLSRGDDKLTHLLTYLLTYTEVRTQTVFREQPRHREFWKVRSFPKFWYNNETYNLSQKKSGNNGNVDND